jgi:hypothetical protein
MLVSVARGRIGDPPGAREVFEAAGTSRGADGLAGEGNDREPSAHLHDPAVAPKYLHVRIHWFSRVRQRQRGKW